MENVLHYVQVIGKILAIGLSLYAIIWSLVSVAKAFVDKMKVAVEQKDWEQMIAIIEEFVTAVEEKYLNKSGMGETKKAEVIALIESAGYEVTKVIDALVEAAVYNKFNKDKNKK